MAEAEEVESTVRGETVKQKTTIYGDLIEVYTTTFRGGELKQIDVLFGNVDSIYPSVVMSRNTELKKEGRVPQCTLPSASSI